MEIAVKFNSSKKRFEGFVDGKMVSRSRHESYVKDQLAKLGFSVGEVVINKYYPAYYGTTGLIHSVTFKGGAWHYECLPMNAKEGYDKIISIEEKNLLPASKRNLTALDKAKAQKAEF